MNSQMDETKALSRQNFAPRPMILKALACGALALGYLDLTRGGMTVSAAMLSLGYLILVPIAIMAVPESKRRAYRTVNKKR